MVTFPCSRWVASDADDAMTELIRDDDFENRGIYSLFARFVIVTI